MDAETSALITAINLFTIYSHRKQLFPFSWSIRVNSDDRQNWDLVEIGTTQGPGTQAPQPVGSSGQLGKEQTRANLEDLFSRHGVEFGQLDSMPHPGTCSVGAELPQDFIRQDGGPTETFSEAPGAYGSVYPLGLLHMRPFQHWLHGRVLRWAWKCGTQITPA